MQVKKVQNNKVCHKFKLYVGATIGRPGKTIVTQTGDHWSPLQMYYHFVLEVTDSARFNRHVSRAD